MSTEGLNEEGVCEMRWKALTGDAAQKELAVRELEHHGRGEGKTQGEDGGGVVVWAVVHGGNGPSGTLDGLAGHVDDAVAQARVHVGVHDEAGAKPRLLGVLLGGLLAEEVVPQLATEAAADQGRVAQAHDLGVVRAPVLAVVGGGMAAAHLGAAGRVHRQARLARRDGHLVTWAKGGGGVESC